MALAGRVMTQMHDRCRRSPGRFSHLQTFERRPTDCLLDIAERLQDGWSVMSIERTPGGAWVVKFAREREQVPIPRLPSPQEGSGL